jgi:death-on-curing protein
VQYLTVDDVARINDQFTGRVLAEFGLLESAVMRPQAVAGGLDAYPTIHEKAAALFIHWSRIARSLTGTSRRPSSPWPCSTG